MAIKFPQSDALEALKAAADAAKEAAGSAANAARVMGGAAAQAAKEAAGNAAEVAKGVADSAADAARAAKEHIETDDSPAPDQVKEAFKKLGHDTALDEAAARTDEHALRPVDAIKLFYFLMAADGRIEATETEKIDLIGAELDADYSQHRDELFEECRACVTSGTDWETHERSLFEGARQAIAASAGAPDAIVPPKLTAWNLLVIAHSDQDIDARERRFAEHVAQLLEVEPAFLAEAEGHLLAIDELEREIDWLKSTDRPYRVIEAHVEETQRRRDAIVENARALVVL